MKSFSAVVALLSCTLVAANPIEIAARQTEAGYPTTIIEIPTRDCTFRPTATVTATTGCPTTCTPTGLCFSDAAVTLECGCTSMAVQPTTVTVCPTATVCRQCQTGWGIVTVTPTTCPAETPAPLPTA
ncbi:hypothetical protein INS49_002763 [Diaporthe citri]|uniref:uncharacterized protein n=1 Tax=Diaporthe citri TaxID=83186 RepID=UPI001C821F4D|nr:uncharacterized protein INS49_002763 [Diaporthe citri]KAG6368550.1 hypothetical protein INS49_002763 [Diaporthe citri]